MSVLTANPPGLRFAVKLASPAGQTGGLARISVEHYLEMVRLGWFDDRERCELLEGYIYEPMPRDPQHDGRLSIADELVRPHLPAGTHLRSQSGFVTDDSVPEPDLAVVRGRGFDYLKRHPGPSDVLLLIEVSNSSRERDRTLKARLNARAGVAEYWVIDVVLRCLVRHREPIGIGESEASYGRVDTFVAGARVPLPWDETRSIGVDDLFAEG